MLSTTTNVGHYCKDDVTGNRFHERGHATRLLCVSSRAFVMGSTTLHSIQCIDFSETFNVSLSLGTQCRFTLLNGVGIRLLASVVVYLYLNVLVVVNIVREFQK